MRTPHTILLSILFGGLVVAGAPARASDTPSAAPVGTLATDAASAQATAAEQSEDDRTICTREKPIGSNHTKRVCRKASEMDTLRSDTHGTLRSIARPKGQIRLP